jgi:CSLREA domain-containing protein/uncharacterized repeat protein (TIGR02543 family)
VGRYLILLAAGFALALPFSDASGVTSRSFTVNSTADEFDSVPGDGICRSSSGKCTLRAALNEASTVVSDGKPLVISVPAGEYKLLLDPPAPTAVDGSGGDLDLASPPAGPVPPSVTLQGSGVGKTILTQTRADRVLEISARAEVIVAGLTIRGGQARQGGGVNNSDLAGLTLQDIEIADNSAEEGGGVYSNQPLAIRRARIWKNEASGAGGGVAVSGRTGEFSDTAILGNRAGQLGGGLWFQNVRSAQIAKSLVVGNIAAAPGKTPSPPSGGGIAVITDPQVGITSVRISDSTVRGNFAAGSGGGLRWEAPGSLSIEGSLFAANTAEAGGGIGTESGTANVSSGTLTLRNTTISGNAAEHGGGIERSFGSTVLTAVTIAGNSAATGSGINFDSARPVYAAATGTIVANTPASRNCSRGTGPFAAGDSLTAPGANLDSGTGCHLGTTDLSTTNPQLSPLANNGGPTQTRALGAASPAIDKYTATGCPSDDQRGFPRPAGSACDIGAVEQGSARPKDTPNLLRISQESIGGTLTLIPRQLFTAESLGGRDFRPCTGRRHLNQPVAGGYFEPGVGQLATRGTLTFRRDAKRIVRLGDLVVLLDGSTGKMLAAIGPSAGAVTLFDLTDVTYGKETAGGQLRLTAAGAQLLNRGLGLRGFRTGMECGRFSVRARIAYDPFVPKPPPPPPPTTTTTTTKTTTTAPTTFLLTASVTPSGSGHVLSSPSGIVCPNDCTENYKPGTAVKLTANPQDSAGYKFDHWTGSCTGSTVTCTVTMTQNRTVQAIFKKKK